MGEIILCLIFLCLLLFADDNIHSADDVTRMANHLENPEKLEQNEDESTGCGSMLLFLINGDTFMHILFSCTLNPVHT